MLWANQKKREPCVAGIWGFLVSNEYNKMLNVTVTAFFNFGLMPKRLKAIPNILKSKTLTEIMKQILPAHYSFLSYIK